MAPTVTFRYGNLFDTVSDLIVLPCSTAGTITKFVAKTLYQYSIPRPIAGMSLGKVQILPFEGGENIAQFVAFAASVEKMSSSLSAIEEIGNALGEFSQKEPSVRMISTPLLGSGFGGLQSGPAAMALIKGFMNTANEFSTLCIYILKDETFELLRNESQFLVRKPKNSPRVFISHTSKTKESIEWVKSLAKFLIDNHIQARIDQFHLRRGMDLPQWMCNELSLAKKVIVICDELYKQKADGRLGGVGWETMIIQGDLANFPPDCTKYQVIVRTENLQDGLPIYLRTKYVFHAPPSDKNDNFRNELLRELLDLPINEALTKNEFFV